MKKYILANCKWFIAILLALNIFSFGPSVASAQDGNLGWTDPSSGQNFANIFQDATGLGNRDPRRIAASIIQIILGFLGVIAVCLILFGGFKWMTAAGDDGKVSDAQDLIKAGVIGLLIILAAFSISVFVINALIRGTGGSGDMIQQN
jgi:hypothetical protein